MFSKSPASGENNRTFKAVKIKQKNSKAQTLSNYTKRTLGVGTENLRAAVKLPPGEDMNEWCAANVVDFFNDLHALYELVREGAAEKFPEPGTGFPAGYEYRWGNNTGGNKPQPPLRVSAPEYCDFVFVWCEDQINNELIFPSLESQPFPPLFVENYVKDIFKRLFRVYAILYHSFFTELEAQDGVAYLNTSFKHFLFFALHFGFLEEIELNALKALVKRLREEYEA